ncbi:hypothetical protein AHAT_19960 [Agarivorans sp. Toyoura001]|uniref:hypothetical protein n=1 Tax=Agarivorans sp. Toyoura001 TaxID=2283141 RepID=UPI0010DA1DD6|nr:hypothetical protein [Agarivorans sp. Toyoura001]GDY26106.1 hypothetical protein AHAT_19960 [Agarivorans sp. Toyoura001]
MSTLEPDVPHATKQCNCKGDGKLHQPQQAGTCQCGNDNPSTANLKHNRCGCSDKAQQTNEALSQSLIDTFIAKLANQHDYQQQLACFKKHHPSIRIIECSEDDMAEREPFISASYFDLFLMANGTSCARLTNSVDLAIGLVVALHEE